MPATMTFSPEVTNFVKGQEGLSIMGIKMLNTIGYGHKITTQGDLERLTAQYGAGAVLDEAQASALLARDLGSTKSGDVAKFDLVNRVKVPVTQGQWDALTQLAFGGAYHGMPPKSGVYDALNRGDDPNDVAEHFFENWMIRTNEGENAVEGPITDFSRGLIERRILQAITFLTGRIETETPELRKLAETIETERRAGISNPIVPRVLNLPQGPSVQK